VSVAIVRFPGTLDHASAAAAVTDVGGTTQFAWHADDDLPDGTSAVLLPGGFSYGDHLRPGAIASRSPIMAAVRRRAEQGMPVLGICNGFQILCESGLLPGALIDNDSLSFICHQADLMVADGTSRWAGAAGEGDTLSIPIKHHGGAWFGDAESTRVVLRYAGGNPNGSVDAVAGVANDAGNVMGLMPHPEEACDPLLGSTDGRVVIEGLLA